MLRVGDEERVIVVYSSSRRGTVRDNAEAAMNGVRFYA